MMRLILISGIVCRLGVSNLLAEPRIACDQPTFDFGSRDASEVVEHTFMLKNSGTTDLVISAIRPACGCTAANLTRQTIPPGESAELSTRLTLAGRSGELHKSILIESNDPANPALQLVLLGKTTKEFEIVPPVMTLRQSAAGQAPAGSVQITFLGKSLRITSTESSDPSLHVRADPLPGGNSYQISAAFEKNPSKIPSPSQITIRTDNTRIPLVRIPTTTVIYKKILVVPDMITFKQGEDNLLKHILIKSSDGNPLEISSISNHATYISVDHSTNKGAIRLTLRGLKPSYELNGQKITIHFTNGEFVEIPFISIH